MPPTEGRTGPGHWTPHTSPSAVLVVLPGSGGFGRLPCSLLLLGGHIEAEVELPAPLGVTGQGGHHPLPGARLLKQPYCGHTSCQLPGEVTERHSIHLSNGLMKTDT